MRIISNTNGRTSPPIGAQSSKNQAQLGASASH
jgi:hypothetical protein